MSSKTSEGKLSQTRRVGVKKKDLKTQGFAWNEPIPEQQKSFMRNKVDGSLKIPFEDEQGVRKTKLLRQYKAKMANPKGKGKPVLIKDLVKQMTTGRLYLYDPKAEPQREFSDGTRDSGGRYVELSEEKYNSIVEHVGDKNGDLGTIYNPFKDDSNPDRFYENNPSLAAEKAKVEVQRLALQKEESEKAEKKRLERKKKFPERFASVSSDEDEDVGGGAAPVEPAPAAAAATVQNTDYDDGKRYKEGDVVEIDEKLYVLDEEFRPYIMDGDDFGEYAEGNGGDIIIDIVQLEENSYSVFPQDVESTAEEIIIDMNTGISIGDKPDGSPTPIRAAVLLKVYPKGFELYGADEEQEVTTVTYKGKTYYVDIPKSKEGRGNRDVYDEESDDLEDEDLKFIILNKADKEDPKRHFYTPPKLEKPKSKPVKKVPTKVETTSTSTMTEIMEIAIKAAVSATIATQTAPPPEPEKQVKKIKINAVQSWDASDLESSIPEDSLEHYKELISRDDAGQSNILPLEFNAPEDVEDGDAIVVKLDLISAGRAAIDAGVPADTHILVQINGEIYKAEEDENGYYGYAGEEGEEEIIGIDNLLANTPEEKWRYGDGDPTYDPQRFRFNFPITTTRMTGFPQ